jgi:hypothetical protein
MIESHKLLLFHARLDYTKYFMYDLITQIILFHARLDYTYYFVYIHDQVFTNNFISCMIGLHKLQDIY